MDLSLSDEQAMLQDSVAKFVQDHYSLDQRRELVAGELGYSRDHWKIFSDLGWLLIPFAEDDGGLGGSSVEVMLLMEQFGKGLVVEPYLATVILAGGLLGRLASGAQRERYLQPLMRGERQAAFGYAEPQARFNAADVTVRAVKGNEGNADGWVIGGHKAVVLNAPSADFLIVSARTSGESREPRGISLFVVECDTPGVEIRDYPTMDGFRAGEVHLHDVRVGREALLGEVGEAWPAIEAVMDEATLGVGAEAVGCMEVLYKETVEYCKQRQQFGQPLSNFQVLQHRMVDMYIEYEQTKSLMFMAALRLGEGPDDAGKKAVSAFKAQVGKGGAFVGRNAVQLHGAMGMTDELGIGHYFKRLTAIEILFGDTDHHLQRFGSL